MIGKFRDFQKKVYDLFTDVLFRRLNEFKTEEEKKKIRKCLIAIGSSVISLILVLSLVAGLVANHYLGKINYGDVAGTDDSTTVVQETTTTPAENKTEVKEPATTKAKKKTNLQKYLEKVERESVIKGSVEVQQKAKSTIDKNLSDGAIWQSDSVYNLLVCGYDAGKIENSDVVFNRSDAILILSLNYAKKTVKMVSISRATYVAVPGHGYKRINTAHAYGGASLLVDTIETNYKIKIDRYITADFSGFSSIIDALGGITLKLSKVEADFAFDDETLPAGEYTLNGQQALRYVRLRKTDSDRTRTGRQRKVLNEIMARAKKMDLSQKLDFMNRVLPYVTTNMTKSELMSKALEMDDYLSWPITQHIVPQKSTSLEMKDGLEVLVLDWDDTVNYVHNLLYDGVTVTYIPVEPTTTEASTTDAVETTSEKTTDEETTIEADNAFGFTTKVRKK